jgi:hypothetical protein
MQLPSTEQFLAKLEANPKEAAEFDAINPHTTRRAAVEKLMNAVRAKQAEGVALRAKLAATNARVVALERARATMPPAKLTLAPTPAPVAAPTKTVTAAEFSTPQVTMTRDEHRKLSVTDKARFFREGNKLSN